MEAWSAYPPDDDNDAWVAVRIDDSTVLATSYSGWLIRIDAESGHETERHFTKERADRSCCSAPSMPASKHCCDLVDGRLSTCH